MNIDRLAPWYRSIEYLAFGRALEQGRFAFFDRMAGAQRVLMLGEGDGRTLVRLLNLAPNASVDVVEISGAMNRLARNRVGKMPGRSSANGQIRFMEADARAVPFPPNHYDRVVTCFFLDCFSETDARELVRRIGDAMEGGGLWLMTDFAIPSQGWRHWHAAVWIAAMYRFFRLTTRLKTMQLPAIDELLSEAGLVCRARQSARAGLIRSGAWEKFRC